MGKWLFLWEKVEFLIFLFEKKVGGKTFKGVSGGEKKRTSIGIEMISDPSVLILDG